MGILVTFDNEYHPIYPSIKAVDKVSKPKVSKPWEPRINPRRKALLDKNPECFYCKCSLDEENSSLDHVIPRSKGGSNRMSNIVLSCKECNRRKCNRSQEEFLAELRQANA